MRSRTHILHAAFGLAFVSLATLPLWACHTSAADGATSDGGEIELMQDVMKRVERSYVQPVKTDELANNALKGMLTGLDPHSDYMDEKQYQNMMSDLRSRFGGIGIELTVQNGVPRVVSPIDGTPAARGGIMPGDFIVKINGQPTNGMGIEEIVDNVRGAPGSKVTLTLSRGHAPPFDVDLTRAIISTVSVKSALEPGKIGYARISTFVENTPAQLSQAIDSMKRDAGGTLKGFVLDLRNDPGGLVDAAVAVAGDFLAGGTVVTTHGREPSDNHVYTAGSNGDRIPGTKIVVLINSGSASASEIVSGALQDRHRATVLGTRSFGKGSVQTIIPIKDHGALRLTTALYYTPSGRSIQDLGITPDVVVGLPKDEQVANGTALHESDLRGAFGKVAALNGLASGAPDAPVPPAETAAGNPGAASDQDEAPIDPALIATAKDSQLVAALRSLGGGAVGDMPK